jgi:hypothetical protein
MAESIGVIVDRMWRDPETRADFERETRLRESGLTEAAHLEYLDRFQHWALGRIRYMDFLKDLEHLINKHSMEHKSADTPDFLLAEYIGNCLKIFDSVVRKRDAWYNKGTGHAQEKATG